MLERIKGGMSKALRRLKIPPFFNKTNKMALLFLLCGVSAALLIAAAAVGFSIYNEGETAGEEAQKLLIEYGQVLVSSEPALADDTNVQPEKPDVEPEDAFDAVQTLSGYQVIGKLTIQRIGVELPVISQMTGRALKVSVCWYQGAMPGEAGNMVIAGHNYANGAHFGRLNELKDGDTVILEAPNGKVYNYEVYDTQVIRPDDVEALEEYQAQCEMTLLTCTAQGNRRLLVRCRMDDE